MSNALCAGLSPFIYGRFLLSFYCNDLVEWRKLLRRITTACCALLACMLLVATFAFNAPTASAHAVAQRNATVVRVVQQAHDDSCDSPYAYIQFDPGNTWVYLNDCAIKQLKSAGDQRALLAALLGLSVQDPIIAVIEAALEVYIDYLQTLSDQCGGQGAILEGISGFGPLPYPVAVC